MLAGKLIGAGGFGGVVPANTHLYSNFSVTNGATFSSVPLGVEHASRYIVVAVNSGSGDARQITGVTVAGVTATKLVESDPAAWLHCTLWIAAVPTGASGDVVITNSTTCWNNTNVAALYLDNGTPVATAVEINTTALDVSANVLGPKGVVVGSGFYYNAYTSTPVGFDLQNRLVSNVYNSDFLMADGLSTETPRTMQLGLSAAHAHSRCLSATFQGA